MPWTIPPPVEQFDFEIRLMLKKGGTTAVADWHWGRHPIEEAEANVRRFAAWRDRVHAHKVLTTPPRQPIMAEDF